MSNPTFNKYKSSTIFGALKVRDLTNSSGSSVVEVASVDLSGNFISRGEATFSEQVIANKAINQENITLPSEVVNKFVYSTFLEGIQSTSISQTQGGTATNRLNNLIIEDIDSEGYTIDTTSFTQNGTKTNTFASPIICNGAISNDKHLTTKEYVDTAVSTGGSVSLSGTNAFTGNNSFNSKFPTSTLVVGTAITNDSIVNKRKNDTIYQSISGMSSYLTTASASSIYQTIANMTNYLTTASASSIYQTIAGMSSYLTTSTAFTTYQTIANMSNYLTTATASSTYSTITNQVKTNTANTFTGVNRFYNDIQSYKAIDQDQPLPSGNINRFTQTSFLEAVEFSKGFNQNGINENNLNNLTIGNITGDTIIITAKSIKQFVNGLAATEANDLDNLSLLTYLNVSGSTTLTGVVINSDTTADNFTINGRSIVQNTTNTETNSLQNLTIATNLTLTNGFITQSGQTTNTMVNLQVQTISTIPATLTNTAQNYSSVKMRNYIFHSRNITTASGITLSTDGFIDNGQYLYVRKINTGVYTLTLTAGTSTTFLNLSNASVSTIAITTLVGVSFVYDKLNTRWIQLT